MPNGTESKELFEKVRYAAIKTDTTIIPFLKSLDSSILKNNKEKSENSTMVVILPIKKEYCHNCLLDKIKKLTKTLYTARKKTTLNPIFFFDFAKKIKRIKGSRSDRIAIFRSTVVIMVCFSKYNNYSGKLKTPFKPAFSRFRR